MIASTERLLVELARLKKQRKAMRIMHQHIPRELERRIRELEAQLSQPVARSHWVLRLWAQRWLIGAGLLLISTALIYLI